MHSSCEVVAGHPCTLHLGLEGVTGGTRSAGLGQAWGRFLEGGCLPGQALFARPEVFLLQSGPKKGGVGWEVARGGGGLGGTPAGPGWAPHPGSRAVGGGVFPVSCHVYK